MTYQDPEIIQCKIDHLTFTFKKKPTQMVTDVITDNLQDIANTLSEKYEIPFNQMLYPKGGYKLCLKLPLFSNISYTGKNIETPHLFIQVLPFNSERAFLRCEVKGHPLSNKEWLGVRLWLERIFSEKYYNSMIIKVRVTKIDIAIDINADIENILFDYTRAQVGGIYFDRKGEIKTIYLGDCRSTSKICIYCRRSKLEQFGLPSKFKHWTRMETRIKLKNTQIDAIEADVGLLKNLSRFTLYDFSAITASNMINPDFIDLCRAWGIKTILQRRTADERRAIRQELSRFSVMPIDKEYIAKLFSDDLKKLVVFSPDFNMEQSKVLNIRSAFNAQYD